jgi:hypothetical protein
MFNKKEVLEIIEDYDKIGLTEMSRESGYCYEPSNVINVQHCYTRQEREEFLKEKGLIELKFKKGDWLKLTEDYNGLKKGEVYQMVEYQTRSENCITVDHVALGKFVDDCGGDNYKSPFAKCLVLATDKEVKETLTKEASRRGLKEGVRGLPIYNDGTKYSCTSYYDLIGGFLFKEDGCLYDLWAEIAEARKMTVEEIEEALGYNIEIVS